MDVRQIVPSVVPPSRIFYPDADPESTSVDGYVARLEPFQTWAQTRDGVGDDHSDISTALTIMLRVSGAAAPNYYSTHRAIITLDMSSMVGETILRGELQFYGTVKEDNEGIVPSIGIFEVAPASMNDLVDADFNTFSDVALSNLLSFPDYNAGGWNTLTLNAAGLVYVQAALDADGMVKLGLREAAYDAPNIEPFAGVTNRIASFYMRSADHSLQFSPRLIVN